MWIRIAKPRVSDFESKQVTLLSVFAVHCLSNSVTGISPLESKLGSEFKYKLCGYRG
jgi:hypothetical protein